MVFCQISWLAVGVARFLFFGSFGKRVARTQKAGFPASPAASAFYCCPLIFQPKVVYTARTKALWFLQAMLLGQRQAGADAGSHLRIGRAQAAVRRIDLERHNLGRLHAARLERH